MGRHLVPKLAAQGAEVTCLVRNPHKAPNLPAQARIMAGDCLVIEDLARLLADQDIFIHMAGLLFGANWQEYFRTNAGIAENINKAMALLPVERRPRKIIFVSSLAAAGPCGKEPGIAETDNARPVSAYGWSKLISENILASNLGSALTIVRPGIIYGSGDRGLLPLFKSVKKGFGASPGAFRKFPSSFIHADDAARAICILCEKPSQGIYHLSDGQYHDMDEACRLMAKAMERLKVRVLHPPLTIMGASAGLNSLWSGAWNKIAKSIGLRGSVAPHWNWDKYREARQAGWLADSSKITREFGFKALTNLKDGMLEAVNGYRADGWL